jgi:transposase
MSTTGEFPSLFSHTHTKVHTVKLRDICTHTHHGQHLSRKDLPAADHSSSSTPDETHRVSLQIEASKTRIQQLSEALKQEETNLERLEELKQSLEKAADEEAASIPSVEPSIIQEVVSTNAGGAKRKAYQAVKPEVKEQVIQNVFERGMTQRKVSEWFGLSERTVRRIIKAEKSVHSGEAPGPKRRRGAKTKLSSGIMTELLFQLEMRPAMTLADMKRYVADHHAVSCTPQSISRMFSSMHVNWKTHLHIPPHWNDPHILQLRHDFVVRRAMDVDKDLIFVGDTGFDLNFNRSQDPSCLGKISNTPSIIFSPCFVLIFSRFLLAVYI